MKELNRLKKMPPGKYTRTLESCMKISQKAKERFKDKTNHPMYGKKQKRGAESPHWKGGRPKCMECGRQIWWTMKRCKRCAAIEMNNLPERKEFFTNLNIVKFAPQYKGGVSKQPGYDNRMIKQWRLNNPEQARLHRKQYRIRKVNGGLLTIKTIQLVYEDNIKKFGTLTCYLCLNPIEFGKDTLEHKTPLIRGGTNEHNNLAIACRNCNSHKHIKTYQEYQEVVKQREEAAKGA